MKRIGRIGFLPTPHLSGGRDSVETLVCDTTREADCTNPVDTAMVRGMDQKALAGDVFFIHGCLR